MTCKLTCIAYLNNISYCVVPLSVKRSENYWGRKQRSSSQRREIYWLLHSIINYRVLVTRAKVVRRCASIWRTCVGGRSSPPTFDILGWFRNRKLVWPMAEWQIGHWKSRLVLSVRFPVLNWRFCSVAKSAYSNMTPRFLVCFLWFFG